MRIPRELLAVALSLAAVAFVRADDGVAPLVERVSRLVEALDAPRRSERRSAEETLLDLGPAVLPFLPPVDRVETASVRETLRRVRRQLEVRQAEDSLKATTVYLEGPMPLRRVVDEITRQTGNRLDHTGVPDERLTAVVATDFDDVPFWRCLDELLAKHGLREVPDEDGNVLRLEVAKPGGRPRHVVYSGAFRVELESLRRRALFGDDGSNLVRATVVVRAEPRLRPLFAKYRGDAVKVTGDLGKPFAPWNPEAELEPPVTRGSIAPRWDLLLPNGDESKGASLAGRLNLVVAAGSETIRFPTLDETTNAERRRGGVVVRTTRATTAKGRAEIDVSVAYDAGGPAFESHRTWVYDSGARLERDGMRFEPATPPTVSRSSDGAVALRYRFEELSGEPEDYRMVYVLPTLVTETTLDFAWKNVPIEGLPRVGGDE